MARRSWAAPIVGTALVILTPAAAVAETDGVSFGDVVQDQDSNLRRDVSIREPGQSKTPLQRTSTPSSGLVWVGIPALGTMEGDDGELVHCRRTRWVRVDRDEREAVSRNAEAEFLDAFARLPELEGHDPNRECAVDPAEDIPPAMLRDAITRTIRDDMPRPTVEVPPGYALTGMEAYLVTNHQLEYGPVTHTVDLGIAVLDVIVTATGVTEVDWGDGTVATYHTPGTPWPDGNVTHTYRDTGIVTISVTDIWQVTYRVPALGIEDTVTAPLPSRTLDDFEVQQVQAVRVSDR
jgi:hypothetical protein